MSLLYDAVEIIACLLSYIYSLYVLGISFQNLPLTGFGL